MKINRNGGDFLIERTLIPLKDLAERWSCTEGYIYKLEGQGILTRAKLSKVCFPIGQIREIEMSNEPSPTLAIVRDLKQENEKLKRQNEYFKNSLAELSKALYDV